jgi:uncharacterized protein YceK
MNLLRAAVCALACAGLTGCGSVVYKDAATTYTVAGRAALKSLDQAASSLAAAGSPSGAEDHLRSELRGR